MKTIRVKYVGFWKGFDPDSFFLTQIMKKYYNVEICGNPDYIICSCFDFYEYLDYEQVRIMFSGENYVPDFNYVDYAISTYPIEFLDRHVSLPGTNMGIIIQLAQKDRHYTREILNEKNKFANMIASHESDTGIRGDLFRILSEYRRVEAGGTYLNNMPGGASVRLGDGTKLELVKKCKFTICPESTVQDGFITEKIFDAFAGNTIPIYCGSRTISEVVNKKAFIDVRDYNSLEDVLKKVIELDKNDDKYLEMLNEPIFVQEDFVEKKVMELEQFIRSIFDQPLHEAYRRSRRYMPQNYENQLSECKKLKNEYWSGRFHSLEWVRHVLSHKISKKYF